VAKANNISVLVHNAKKDFVCETILTYTPSDGGKGFIVKIKPRPKEDK
jgi:hypothetical protein